jgi:hypothetical protein
MIHATLKVFITSETLQRECVAKIILSQGANHTVHLMMVKDLCLFVRDYLA